MTGIKLIEAERQRQVAVEGWTPDHDDEHLKHELVLAAICYATPERLREYPPQGGPPAIWPWDPEYWLPSRTAGGNASGRIHELVKAGALIAAEIDRLNRELNRSGA